MQDQHQPPPVINITYLVQEPAESRGSMVRQGGRCVREQVVILFYFWNSNYHQALPLVWSGLAESLLRNIASWSLLSLSSLSPQTLPANTAEINIWKDWNKEQCQTVRDRHSQPDLLTLLVTVLLQIKHLSLWQNLSILTITIGGLKVVNDWDVNWDIIVNVRMCLLACLLQIFSYISVISHRENLWLSDQLDKYPWDFSQVCPNTAELNCRV